MSTILKILTRRQKRYQNLPVEYFEYYLTKSFEERSVKDYFNALLKFHPLILSGISLVGMIYYFAYFGLEFKYFPDLGGADVAYVGVSLFFVSSFISFFIIFPCLVYPGYYENKKIKLGCFILGFPCSLFLYWFAW
ncbi:hypothetical protein [Campylobacter concisus]|uniref:hypothetical protein n=1 Tax=Campylobacter concisus TaxID=199 RepID=UPI000D309FB3|nr:hypothetical protein [Campylobacter concisus]